MDAGAVPEALSDRLGVEATAALVDLVEVMERDVTETVVMRSMERFERRLIEETAKLRLEIRDLDAALRLEVRGLKSEVHQGLGTLGAGLRQEMGVLKFEMLKWSFLFWVGQVAAIAALLRFAGR